MFEYHGLTGEANFAYLRKAEAKTNFENRNNTGKGSNLRKGEVGDYENHMDTAMEKRALTFETEMGYLDIKCKMAGQYPQLRPWLKAIDLSL